MNAHRSSQAIAPRGLALFAKLVVLLTFALIFVGGHTTTSGAGMAFPDWPLSNGSLNPDGWWTNVMMRLEHGHRLTAGIVAACVAVLFGWTWRQRARLPRGSTALAGGALVGVLAQAVLGGLRVVLDPQGIAATTSTTATVFRVLHGCAAQIELCLLVALAAVLSPAWMRITANVRLTRASRFGWIAATLIFVQLIVGATMRHLGAGLAIPTFPHSAPDGAWLPPVHNLFVDLNFTHTRLGALLVALFVVLFATQAMRGARGDSLIIRPAIGLCLLLVVQVLLGMFVIWRLRPPLLTTLHVVNGAGLLAVSVLLTLRTRRAAALAGNASVSPATQSLIPVAV